MALSRALDIKRKGVCVCKEWSVLTDHSAFNLLNGYHQCHSLLATLDTVTRIIVQVPFQREEDMS